MCTRIVARHAAAAVLCLALTSGCAVSYVDKSGFEHTIGLFHQKVKVEHQLLHVQRQSVGLNLSLSEGDAGFNLGYKNSYRVFVPENMVLISDIDSRGHAIIEVAE